MQRLLKVLHDPSGDEDRVPQQDDADARFDQMTSSDNQGSLANFGGGKFSRIEGQIMSLTSVLNKISGRQSERKAERLQNYAELVRAIHAGTEPPEDDIENILEASGRATEDLARDVKLVADRSAWAAMLVTDGALLAEHNQLVAEEQAADSEAAETIRLAKAKHAARVGPLQARRVAIAYQRDAGQTARNKLVETSPQRQRLAKLCAERGSLVISLEGELARQLRHALPGIAKGNVEAEIARTEVKVEQLAAEIARLEAEALLP